MKLLYAEDEPALSEALLIILHTTNTSWMPYMTARKHTIMPCREKMTVLFSIS